MFAEMKRHHIEEVTSEDGTTWNILEKSESGTLICKAQCLDEHFAGTILSALKWIDAMGGTMLSLRMDGITIDANDGHNRRISRAGHIT